MSAAAPMRGGTRSRTANGAEPGSSLNILANHSATSLAASLRMGCTWINRNVSLLFGRDLRLHFWHNLRPKLAHFFAMSGCSNCAFAFRHLRLHLANIHL